LQLFVYGAFPIHVWTIVNMFIDIPSWLVYMTSWELISAIAYTLTFALIESLLVFIVVLMVGMSMPRRWSGDRFLTIASAVLVEGALFAIGLHVLILNDLPKKYAVLGFGFVVFLTILFSLRIPNLVKSVRLLSDRLSVLTSVYIFFDVLGCIIVLVRNL
jgi:hypothetical protein